jgi:hypothetical protein
MAGILLLFEKLVEEKRKQSGKNLICVKCLISWHRNRPHNWYLNWPVDQDGQFENAGKSSTPFGRLAWQIL